MAADRRWMVIERARLWLIATLLVGQGQVLAAEKKFTQEAGLYRSAPGAPESAQAGSAVLRVQCLNDLPYAYPEIFAFSPEEVKAVCATSRRHASRFCQPVAPQPLDDKRLLWIDPFSAPDNKSSRFAFKVSIENHGDTPFDMSQIEAKLLIPGSASVAPAKEPHLLMYWLMEEESRFQQERGMSLMQRAQHPNGFTGLLFYGHRFQNWSTVDATKLIVEPGKSRWGLLVFARSADVDSASLILDGPALASAGGASGRAIFPIARVWKKIELDPATKHWVETAGQVSVADRSARTRARNVLVFNDWNASPQGKDADGDLRHYLEKLRHGVNAMPRFGVRYRSQSPAAGGVPEREYLCNGTIVIHADERQDAAGMPMRHYELEISTSVVDAVTSTTVLTKSLKCVEDDTPRDTLGTVDRKGEFTTRDIVMWRCAEQIAKDMAREISNAFPLAGEIVAGDDGQFRIDIGTDDGVERGMRFRLMRPEGVVVAAEGTSIEKPAIEIGELQVEATGRNAAEVKVVRLTKGLALQLGDRVEMKPKAKGFLQRATEALENTNEAIKK